MDAKGKADDFIDALKSAEAEKLALTGRISKAGEAKRLREEAKFSDWIKRGLADAEGIFAWARQFKNNLIGRRLFDLIDRAGDGKKSVLFFSVKGRRADIPNLCIPEYGIICYCGHDHRGRYIRHLTADTPDTLASWCSPEVLRLARESIHNGEAYAELKRQVERRMMVLRSEVERAEKENQDAK